MIFIKKSKHLNEGFQTRGRKRGVPTLNLFARSETPKNFVVPLSSLTNKGFTLIEVIITLFLLFVGISGSFLLIYRLLTMSEINNSRLIAANLAQEGVEIVKNIRDSNWIEEIDWDAGLENDGDYEVAYDSVGLDLCSATCFTDHDINNLWPLNIHPASNFYDYVSDGSEIETKFKRMITISHPGDCDDNCVKATVAVYWQDRWGDFEFIIEEDIYNWDY